MADRSSIMMIEDITTGEVYFVSDSLKKLIQDNINVLLDGFALEDVMFEGKFKTLELTNNMKFILKPQED